MAWLQTINHGEVAPGIFVLERVDQSGWGWNVILVRLPSGGLWVYSPSWLGPKTFELIDAIGKPKVLFAPNSYHHVTLGKFRKQYPEAIACAPPEALKRLGQKGHEGLQDATDFAHLLPEGSAMLQTPGTKTGEAWLAVRSGGMTSLIVCDAFFNIVRPTHGFVGMALKLLKVVPGLRISRTYRFLAIADKKTHVSWAVQTMERFKPERLFVTHGVVVQGKDLPDRLIKSLKTEL